ncbi:condensation domain-containing protein, partial [Kitasatospora sp. NPDC056327]|uniref:condensation domain-containing protein n=1 Tax=Kitasatospora sp. NPDC056327 TaxID=3345785 RepID=UPI0035D82315
ALRAGAAADRRGLRLPLADIFANPTIATQALVASSVSVAAGAGDEPVGPTAMTPSQQWFLAQDLPERHHWNDASFLLALQRPLDTTALAGALDRVLGHHDALRLRFARGEDGAWRARVAAHRTGGATAAEGPAGPADGGDALPFDVHDLSRLDAREQKRRSVEISDHLQASLDLEHGPLLRVAYFDMGERPHCVLFLAHWLAVDHYSGRIVLEDLFACYSALEAGGDGALPARTTSFRSWTRGLADYANSPEVVAEWEHWTGEDRRRPATVAVDAEDGPNSLESLENVTVRVEREVTDALLHVLPGRMNIDVSQVLCAAVLRSVPGADGPGRLLVDLERHGRDLPVPGADVSRTVGRFSTLVPVLLAHDPADGVGRALERVREQTAALPGRGAGHGLLSYLWEDPRARELRAMPAAPVGVNYLGQVDEVFLRSDLLSVPRSAFGRQRSGTGTRFRLIDVIGFVVAGRLNLTVGFSGNRHDAASRKAFVDALVAELGAIARWAKEA